MTWQAALASDMPSSKVHMPLPMQTHIYMHIHMHMHIHVPTHIYMHMPMHMHTDHTYAVLHAATGQKRKPAMELNNCVCGGGGGITYTSHHDTSCDT